MPIVLWVTPHQGEPARLVAGWHTTPDSMSLRPSSEGWCDPAPARSPLHWGPIAILHPQRAGPQASEGCVGSAHACLSPGPSPEPTITVTVENSVCPKQPVLAECLSMEWPSIDRVWQWSCADLGAP